MIKIQCSLFDALAIKCKTVKSLNNISSRVKKRIFSLLSYNDLDIFVHNREH